MVSNCELAFYISKQFWGGELAQALKLRMGWPNKYVRPKQERSQMEAAGFLKPEENHHMRLGSERRGGRPGQSCLKRGTEAKKGG